jgi:hypothetical protein
MRTEASAVVDSTIADTSTSPRMTRTMVLMFVTPSLYAQACPASQSALPTAGRRQAAFQISPHPSKSRTPSAVIATPPGFTSAHALSR